MKKDIVITAISLILLVTGFLLFMAGFKYSILLTLIGVFIYLYLNKKNKEKSSDNSG